MRSFFDPTFGFGNFLEDVGKSWLGEDVGEQQNKALHQQAKLAEVQGARDIRDEQAEQKLRTSRMLALAAARGRGADLLQTISADAEESAIRQYRIGADASAQAKALRYQGRAAKAAAEPTVFTAISSLGNLFMTGQGMTQSPNTLLRGQSTITPTTPAYRKTRSGRLGGPV